MRFKKYAVPGVIMIFMLLGCLGTSFSQDGIIQGPPLEDSVQAPDVPWIWAEVVAVDPQANQLVVRTVDYEKENNAEKEMVIAVDDKTTYENIKSLSELKAGDTVTIDYIAESSMRNIARNISLEKPEDSSEEMIGEGQVSDVPQEPQLSPLPPEPSSGQAE
jgi:hypothetical protein